MIIAISILKGFNRQQIALTLTLTLGLGLSVLAAFVVSRWEISNRQSRFQRQIENLTTALQRSLNRYTDVLAFLGDYYQVAQLEVTREDFAKFVERSHSTYSGIQALEWAPLVPKSQRFAYEEKVRQEGYPNFEITELTGDNRLIRAGDRLYYFPVTYVEPFKDNESALGYDLNSNITRAEAIAQTRDTGQITATARIKLVQEKHGQQFGFLVFLPIYQNHRVPKSPDKPRQDLRGVLVGVFRISDVVEESLLDLQYEIDFTIYDRTGAPSEQFLGRYDALHKEVTTHRKSPLLNASVCPSGCTRNLAVGQRQWLIVFSPSVNYPFERQYGAIITLVGGLLLTSSLGILLHNLNRELQQTKNLSDLKFRFFSMASHELRTPLTIILLSSESLQINHDKLSQWQKLMNIQRIHLTAKRMSQQITDILTITRAEAGKLEFNPELLNLEYFCQQIVEEMQIGITQPIQFLNTCQPTRAFLDKKLLQSLLTNLIYNAAKYSPTDAPIDFRLGCEDNIVIFEIKDRGLGIPVEDQPRIWEAFYRGSNVGGITGTGLGLAVVKTCIDLHQGEWAINSQPGKGTTVIVKLPLE